VAENADRYFSIYLNDHLAGASAGLELAAALKDRAGMEPVMTQLSRDIEEDRRELQAIVERHGTRPSRVRQAAGWMTEKLTEIKTRLDDSSDGALQTFELIEALAIGIDGKRALWTALEAVSDSVPALHGVDFRRLIARADDQRRLVEAHRVRAATAAFGGSRTESMLQPTGA